MMFRDFDCEPKASYINAYNDRIYSGSIYHASRSYIGSNVSGAYDGYIRSLTDFGLYSNVHDLSGSQKHFTNHSPLFDQAFQKNVTYFDSYVPFMDEVMQTDAYGLVLTNVPNPSGWPAASFIYPISTYDRGVLQRIHAHTAPSQSISSDYWAITPPFSRRYANVRRVKNVTTNVADLNYRASCSFGTLYGPASPTPRPIANFAATSTPASSMSYDSTDSFWGGVATGFMQPVGNFSPAFVTSNYQTSSYYPANISGSNPSNYTTDTHILMSITGTVDSNHNFIAGSGLTYPPITWPLPNSSNPRPSSPANSDVIKALYGFGDGPSNTPWFSNRNGSSWVINGPLGFFLRYGTVIRGWKYGLLSGFPTNPKVIYRHGRYGQMRDMLEQRLFTKTIDDKGNFDIPVEVIFVSGSQAALTSSNPSLNPYDSGIYDKEYRRGQWFTDV